MCVKKAQTNNVNEAGNGEWKMGARGRDGLTSAKAGETRAVAWMGGRAGVRPVACPAGRGQADVGGVVSAEVSERP